MIASDWRSTRIGIHRSLQRVQRVSGLALAPANVHSIRADCGPSKLNGFGCAVWARMPLWKSVAVELTQPRSRVKQASNSEIFWIKNAQSRSWQFTLNCYVNGLLYVSQAQCARHVDSLFRRVRSEWAKTPTCWRFPSVTLRLKAAYV